MGLITHKIDFITRHYGRAWIYTASAYRGECQLRISLAAPATHKKPSSLSTSQSKNRKKKRKPNEEAENWPNECVLTPQ